MAELAAKQKEIEAVKVEKDRLVEKLKKDQVSYGNEISKLKKEKAALEKQIVAIIKAQTKAKTKPKTKVKKTTVTVKKKDPKTGKITTTKEVKTENVVVQENYSTSEIIKNVGYLSRPVDGSVKYNFGQMKSGEVSSSAMEIKAKLGQRISAAGDGEVIFAGSLTNLGNVVIINHGYGLTSTYGNLISVYVGKGTNVKKGQQIGVLGLSSDREPVLYFETRISSKAVDPRTFLN
jgi:septal ring factor EnvC (AmiA/AmiB activator)